MVLNDLFDEQKRVASVLIRQGARAVIVSHETGLAAEVARRLYKHLKKEASPSGLLPDSVEYFFSGHNRTHSTAFWWCYKAASERLNRRTPDTPRSLLRGQILAVAYDHYSRICGGAHNALPIDRMWHLTRVVKARDQVIETHCRVCNASYLGRSYEAGFICDHCTQDAKAAK
jgi:hypothetical protein